ncbi:hypothetical protein MLGJGCBP_07792 [Rhodococcus sp. T7]|nr:hypothetical protein MLGJGCBP_07792 [Rhodococcus sp. T7]
MSAAFVLDENVSRGTVTVAARRRPNSSSMPMAAAVQCRGSNNLAFAAKYASMSG